MLWFFSIYLLVKIKEYLMSQRISPRPDVVPPILLLLPSFQYMLSDSCKSICFVLHPITLPLLFLVVVVSLKCEKTDSTETVFVFYFIWYSLLLSDTIDYLRMILNSIVGGLKGGSWNKMIEHKYLSFISDEVLP